MENIVFLMLNLQMRAKSMNSGVEKDKNKNPFKVSEPDLVWEEWKKKGKPISRESLFAKVREAARLQNLRKDAE